MPMPTSAHKLIAVTNNSPMPHTEMEWGRCWDQESFGKALYGGWTPVQEVEGWEGDIIVRSIRANRVEIRRVEQTLREENTEIRHGKR